MTEDTIWIADWNFDAGDNCNSTGWTKQDLRVLNDGSNYWSISSAIAGTDSIAINGAMLGKHDVCFVAGGYGNDWDCAIVLKYKGPNATLSFNNLSASEPG